MPRSVNSSAGLQNGRLWAYLFVEVGATDVSQLRQAASPHAACPPLVPVQTIRTVPCLRALYSHRPAKEPELAKVLACCEGLTHDDYRLADTLDHLFHLAFAKENQLNFHLFWRKMKHL